MSTDRRCLVIDDHPTLRMGVRELLAERYDIDEVADGEAALELLTALGDFDVAIVELANAKGGTLVGLAAIRALRKARPGLGIVAHAGSPERRAADAALDAGATAYVSKRSPVEALEAAVEAAASAERFVDPAMRDEAGRRSPTRRQREILQLLANGESTDDAARRLGLSAETVRTHTKAALARLGARDRAHAIAIALRAGVIE